MHVWLQATPSQQAIVTSTAHASSVSIEFLFFTTVAANLAIWSANVLAPMCCAMPFSAHVLKKNRFSDVDIVVQNKSKGGLSWSVVFSTTSTRHYSLPKHFFVLFLHVERVSKSQRKPRSPIVTEKQEHNTSRRLGEKFQNYCRRAKPWMGTSFSMSKNIKQTAVINITRQRML